MIERNVPESSCTFIFELCNEDFLVKEKLVGQKHHTRCTSCLEITALLRHCDDGIAQALLQMTKDDH